MGWLIALAYLFCILAPAAALAWGNGAAPCLADDALLADLVPVHHEMPASHMHGGSSHDHANMHAHHQTAAQEAPANHHHDGKGTAGPCCAMMCATALPAALPDIAKPLRPISACTPEIALAVHSEAPPLLYRPPIA